jgi:hypothetical protein
MTIQEFNSNNIQHNMPCESIGQGCGYKSRWDLENPDDIIYIPEHAYEKNEDGTINRDDAYSVRDFLRLTNNRIAKAKELFEYVDWQYPETVIDEGFLEE